MTIIDTTVWIDYFRGTVNPETTWLELELGLQALALTDLILCEVLQGIRDDATYKRIHRELAWFPVFPSSGAKFAIAAAENYRLLRARGYTVRTTIDSLIAAFCLEHGHALLHRDRDFELFERELGLQVVHP